MEIFIICGIAIFIIILCLFFGGLYGAQQDPYDVMEVIAPRDEELKTVDDIVSYLDKVPENEVIGRCDNCNFSKYCKDDKEKCYCKSIKEISDKF